MNCPRCGKDNPADVHTCTPLAARLAEALADYTGCTLAQMDQAATELRRLSTQADKDEALLREALKALEGRVVNRYMEDLNETIAALRERLKETT
jgi:hypothetical protein